MRNNNENRLLIAGGVILATFVLFLWPHTLVYDGDGEVSLFPESASAKNYRLTASIDVTDKWHGWWGNHDISYDVSRANWPNGGYAEFDDCVVSGNSRADCDDQGGTTYSVEITTPPDPPEADYDY